MAVNFTLIVCYEVRSYSFVILLAIQMRLSCSFYIKFQPRWIYLQYYIRKLKCCIFLHFEAQWRHIMAAKFS